MRILWHIIHGENRFSELKKALSGISEKVLYTSLIREKLKPRP